jgi:hypothetical protein
MPRRDPRAAPFSAARQWHTLLVNGAAKIRIDEPRAISVIAFTSALSETWALRLQRAKVRVLNIWRI